jgi:steroid 5-alpha reductase family enzyme
VVALWGIRLTANWAYTFANLKHQDWRYTMLKEKTGKYYPIINFVGIHLVPTLIVYACVLPAVFVMQSGVNNVFSFVFIVISLLAATMQGVADIQMHKFRKNKTKENFIRNGLWKYSRHPNYLGEILMWWGVGLASVFALGWNSWYLLCGAVLNTLLFLFVSIPMADQRQSRKEGFEEYKKQTFSLLPLPKK